MKKVIILILSYLFLVAIICLAISSLDNNEYELNSRTWRDGIENSEYMNIRNFSDGICGTKYYSPTFRIEDGVLYDYFDKAIKDNVFSILEFTHGDCEIQETFITLMNGDLLYLNNLEDSKYSEYELVYIVDVSKIMQLEYNEDGEIDAIDTGGSHIEIKEKLQDIIDL